MEMLRTTHRSIDARFLLLPHWPLIAASLLLCIAAFPLYAADASDYCEYGISLYKKGKLKEAARQFRYAIRLDPRSFQAHSGLGVVLYAQGEKKEAIEAWQDALKINSRSASVHSNLAAALVDIGKSKQALTHCQKAIKIKPKFAGAHFNLGRAYYKLGKHDNAISAYNKALKYNPKFADAWMYLGLAYAKGKNEPQKAIRYFKQYLRLNENPDVCTCWVQAYVDKHEK